MSIITQRVTLNIMQRVNDGWMAVPCMFDLEIDSARLVKQMSEAAMKNKTHKSKLRHGAIIVEYIGEKGGGA